MIRKSIDDIAPLLWNAMQGQNSARAIVREAIMKFNKDDNLEELLVIISLCLAAKVTGEK